MKALAAVLAASLVLVWSSPAVAWDPLRERPSAARPAPTPATDSAPFIAPPPGIYYVTDTYVTDVVTTSGPLTTYTTTTIHESTGSWARVLETVGTGILSAYDGIAFNGRRSLSDGRPVAGTYYENFVLTEAGFVPVSVVFFQDDAELARLAAETTAAQRTPTPEPTSASAPVRTPIPFAPCCATSQRPHGTPPAGSTPSLRPVRPVLSLLPVSAPLTRIEVLRGRAVSLWLRAFVDEHEVPVRTWSVESGEVGDAAARSGVGTEPFRTSWRVLAPVGSSYNLVFRLEVDTPETGRRIVKGTILVTVRSPALEE